MKAFYGVDNKIRVFRPDQNMQRFRISAARMCLPDFNGDELLKCIIELVKLEKEWVPKERGYSLYIRPSLVSLDVSESAIGLFARKMFYQMFTISIGLLSRVSPSVSMMSYFYNLLIRILVTVSSLQLEKLSCIIWKNLIFVISLWYRHTIFLKGVLDFRISKSATLDIF